MNVIIDPRKLSGAIDAIPSKSHAHRVLIAQKLAQLQGQKKADSLVIPTFSEDIGATKNCLVQMDKEMPFLDCKESGSTLRFMLPVAMALKDEAVFIGSGKLPYRPISPLKEEMEAHGCVFQMGGKHQKVSDKYKEICTIRGRLEPGEYRLAGNVSSQFITGLLFALPLLDGDSVLTLTTKLESAGYVDLTLDVLRSFGIKTQIKTSQEGFLIYEIPGGQRYTEPDDLVVEGDWSNAAFWLACGALDGDITVRGLDPGSSQRDKEIVNILKSMGADITITTANGNGDADVAMDRSGRSGGDKSTGLAAGGGARSADDDRSVDDDENAGIAGGGARSADDGRSGGDESTGLAADGARSADDDRSVDDDENAGIAGGGAIIRCHGGLLKGAEVSVSQIPDLVPVLAATMSLAGGSSLITDAQRLKIKESDRLMTVYDFLSHLGADISYGGEGLSLTGQPSLEGGDADGHNDHRIVMAAAVASCGCRQPVTIRGAEAVKKSYPNFFEDFAALGGSVREI